MSRPRAKPTLILVRHGETEGESSIRYHGRGDVPLSELGRTQMRAARNAIVARHGGIDFAATFTTPLSRASEGARLIVGRAAPIVTLEEFAEVHFGIFEGLTAEEIQHRFPDEFARWRASHLDESYTYPGGESRADFTQRVLRGVDAMLSIWSPHRGAEAGRALVVAHRGVIRAIVNRLTGNQPSVELGSIQVIQFDREWTPVALDLVEHLDPLAI